MANFYGTDPKGRLVVLHDTTFNHIAEGHPELAPHRGDIEATLVMPDVILSNAPTFGRSTYQKERTADVRYYRYSSAVGAHIVVPVRLAPIELRIDQDAPLVVSGGTARTAYPTAQVPTNVRALYRRSA